MELPVVARNIMVGIGLPVKLNGRPVVLSKSAVSSLHAGGHGGLAGGRNNARWIEGLDEPAGAGLRPGKSSGKRDLLSS